MIGELLEHMPARLCFPCRDLFRDFDSPRWLARLVMKRPLEREIDEARDPVIFANRNLPCDQRGHAHRLQRREQVADAAARLVDAVDEQEVRNALLVEHP